MTYTHSNTYPIIKALFFIAWMFTACNDKGVEHPESTGSAEAINDSAKKAKAYFPVMDYIKSEIRFVDSLPVGIKKYVQTGNRTDSAYIKLEEFHAYASAFLSPELEPAAFTTNYRESSFYDRSTKASTFLYQANNDAAPIKRIDIQSRPDEAYDKVFNIYMERMHQAGDTLVIKKMTWKPGRQLEVIESTIMNQQTQATPAIRQVRIVWDNWKEE